MRRFKKPSIDGVVLQKKHGQYFLRDHAITDAMLKAVDLSDAFVFEIGCGDGFLTKEILKKTVQKLSVFEIDQSWADVVAGQCKDPRLTMHVTDFLQVTREDLVASSPSWIVLSNLPYHMTFPILYHLYGMGDVISHGVFMMQEEVAQKIVKTHGKGYGYISLFFQYYFDWQLLAKVPPTAFYPEPRVFSRLISFKRKQSVEPIKKEEDFWKFIKLCFSCPRRTLKNNLIQTHFEYNKVPQNLLQMRSQQLSITDFLTLWNDIILE